MNCQHCNTLCGDDHLFCHHCGHPLTETADVTPIEEPIPDPVAEEEIPVVAEPVSDEALPPEEVPAPAEELPPEEAPVEETPVEEVPAEVPPAPKGRLWVPAVILSVMILLGTALFFLMPGTQPENTGPTVSPTEYAWFTIENGALSFHAEYYTGGSELEIPSVVNGQTVTAIADYGFSGTQNLTAVILPETVTKIGDYSFSGCKGLRGMYVPSTVTSIGVYAFADCDKLEAIYLPGELTALGHGSLDSCDSLTYILFNGTYSQWNRLYDGYFTTYVELHTIDGTYYSKP